MGSISDNAEFQTSLRLLDTAVFYRKTKGSPIIYLWLTKDEENLFKSFLGVETSPDPLNESKLIFDAGLIALIGYRLFGRGVICFFGEKPEYSPREENMPDNILALVDEYNPDREYIVVSSNHGSAMLLEFEEIGIEVSRLLSEKEYKQELEKVLDSLVQQGLNKNLVKNLREVALEFRGENLRLKSYPPEILSVFQHLSQEAVSKNLESLVNFLNSNVPRI